MVLKSGEKGLYFIIFPASMDEQDATVDRIVQILRDHGRPCRLLDFGPRSPLWDVLRDLKTAPRTPSVNRKQDLGRKDFADI